MASRTYKAWSVVTASTTAFTVCFMVWMMFAVIGIPIKQNLGLNETQFGILVALPVLTGSLIRLPLGMWTDRFGGRIVFLILMLSTVFPIWLISRATEFWHYLVTGLFVGVAGGSFTVGIAYCARWFPKHRQGLAMGIFGAGNTGAAVNKLVAPSIVVADIVVCDATGEVCCVVDSFRVIGNAALNEVFAAGADYVLDDAIAPALGTRTGKA